MPPFFGEGGIDPFAEPGSRGPPAQALGLEQVPDPAPFDGAAVQLVEVGGQAVECPTREGQAEILGRGQDCRDYGPVLSRRRGRGPTPPWRILQSSPVRGVEPRDSAPDGVLSDAGQDDDLAGHRARAADADPVTQARFHRLATGHDLERGGFLLSQRAKQQQLRPGDPPTRTILPTLPSPVVYRVDQ